MWKYVKLYGRLEVQNDAKEPGLRSHLWSEVCASFELRDQVLRNLWEQRFHTTKSQTPQNPPSCKWDPCGCFQKWGVSQNGWFIMENPIRMDDLGVPLFLETPMWVTRCDCVHSIMLDSLIFLSEHGCRDAACTKVNMRSLAVRRALSHKILCIIVQSSSVSLQALGKDQSVHISPKSVASPKSHKKNTNRANK